MATGFVSWKENHVSCISLLIHKLSLAALPLKTLTWFFQKGDALYRHGGTLHKFPVHLQQVRQQKQGDTNNTKVFLGRSTVKLSFLHNCQNKSLTT